MLADWTTRPENSFENSVQYKNLGYVRMPTCAYCTPCEHSLVIPQNPSPNWNFLLSGLLYNPGPSQDAWFVRASPVPLLFLELCPKAFYSVPSPPGMKPFSALPGLRPQWIGAPPVPRGLWPFRAASISCYALRAFALSGTGSMAFPSLFLTPLGLCHLKLAHPGLRRI